MRDRLAALPPNRAVYEVIDVIATGGRRHAVITPVTACRWYDYDS